MVDFEIEDRWPNMGVPGVDPTRNPINWMIGSTVVMITIGTIRRIVEQNRIDRFDPHDR